VQTEKRVVRDGDTIGVLIVDDQPPFRSVARTVVSLAPGFSVAGEVESGEESVETMKSLDARLVLMDINLGGMNGIEATRRIIAEHPDTVVILLSTYTEADLPADARTCGAARYVHKEDLSPAVIREVWDEAEKSRT
jgi:two-component system invasion response regulator UvrY